MQNCIEKQSILIVVFYASVLCNEFLSARLSWPSFGLMTADMSVGK